MIPLLAATSLLYACDAPPAACAASERGIAHHQERRLKDASEAYSEALRLAPTRDPTPEERALIRRHAPRLLLTPNEFFPLKDFAAVLHPSKPLIAYHLFWEDDIDFPDDNDPCDHEVVWVRLDATRRRVTAYFTYFHGRIVRAPAESVADANRHDGRAAIWVQWGKHGSMPAGWDQLESANRADFTRLATTGRQSADSPLGKGWPVKFPGSWKDFTNYSKLLDPVSYLQKQQFEKVSYFNNAVINRHFLRYNFAAKTEWPPE